MNSFTITDLKLGILKCLSGTTSAHAGNKFNLLGRQYQAGGLEGQLRVTFDPKQRGLANRAFEELKASRLIEPTLSDLVDPENWVAITEAGRVALASGMLDDLDAALSAINPALLELRRGAWAALASTTPDSLRQAAHSAREMINQTLQQGAPDDEVKVQPDFRPDPTSKSGVTRRMRLRYIMNKRPLSSDSDIVIAEKAVDLVLALTDRLSAAAHDRDVPSAADIKDAVATAEMALRRILL
jgi:hypothetical protein